jgi:hypothetical protein
MGSKAAFWERHLAVWCDSGLSQAAYCRQHGLSLPCFGYWRGKRRSAAAHSAQALVPIVVAEATRADDRIEVALPNGVQVRLPVGVDATRWVPMLQALLTC